MQDISALLSPGKVLGKDLAFAQLTFRFSEDQWFPTGSSFAAHCFPSSSPGHLAKVWRHFGCHSGGALLAYPWVEDMGAADYLLVPRPAPVTAEGWVH